MRVGVAIEPRTPGAVEFAQEAERLGAASLWVPEVWGYDALTGLAYLAAHTGSIGLGSFVVQLGARSPALLATSALSLQQLSRGRFTLGVGVSGPQVMEGWHGVRFTRPVQRTRESIEIIRIVSSGQRLAHDGEIYPLPLPDSDGVALRPMVAAQHVPVYVAAMGPANLRLTGELADGWLGNAFIPEVSEVYLGPLRDGVLRAGRDPAEVSLVAPVAVEFTDAAEQAARRHADGYAFTIGAMGGARNFYAEAFSRLGFGEAVARVAELWRCGDREAAGRAVPTELGAATNLLGTPEAVTERVGAYRDAGIGTLLAKLDGPYERQIETLRLLLTVTAGLA
jgi:F420-dependent oxidoreductase-like protein